jgi:hypothetical protein
VNSSREDVGLPGTFAVQEERKMMDYIELATLADKVLEIAGDDEEELAMVLDTLDASPRSELLVSDFLNAYQAFFYFFRMVPDALVREHLILIPASDIQDGVLVEEVDLYQIVFLVRENVPYVAVGDGEHLLVKFQGKGAYRAARQYIEEIAIPV